MTTHVTRWHRTIYAHGANINFLISILYYSHINCNCWGKWRKGIGDLSVPSLQTPVNLKLFQSLFFKKKAGKLSHNIASKICTLPLVFFLYHHHVSLFLAFFSPKICTTRSNFSNFLAVRWKYLNSRSSVSPQGSSDIWERARVVAQDFLYKWFQSLIIKHCPLPSGQPKMVHISPKPPLDDFTSRAENQWLS